MWQQKWFFPSLVVLMGILLMSISGGYFFGQKQTLVANKELVTQYHELQKAEAPHHLPVPIHIQVGQMVDTKIEGSLLVGEELAISDKTASYLLESARPGENGNVIIYGHNKRSIMGNIRAFGGGEYIKIKTEDGTTHHYRVASVQEVDPTQTEFLKPTDFEVLTLYTCSGFLDQKRFIVRAEPINAGS